MSSQKKITYESFTERVANRAKVSQADANAYIHQFSDTAGEALEEGDEVQLYRFGRFVTQHVDQRAGHNPQTGDSIIIPEHTRVLFHPYQALLTAVNWPFRHLQTRMLSEEKPDEQDKHISSTFWLFLFLGLLLLILMSFAINRWMSGSSNDFARPTFIPASIELADISMQAPAARSKPVPAQDVSTMAKSAPEELPTVSTVKITNILVSRGDTLWGIAVSQWGDASWWPVIYAENRKVLALKNPDFIATGILLRMPVLAGGVVKPTNSDLIEKTNAYRIVAEDYTRVDHKRAAEYRFVAAKGFSQTMIK